MRPVVLAVLLLFAPACGVVGGHGPTPAPTARPITNFAADGGSDGAVAFDVGAVACGYDNVITADRRVAARQNFCLANNVTIANASDKQVTIDPACQFLLAGQARYPARRDASELGSENAAPFTTGVAPGAKAGVSILFDVPVGATPTAIELHAACGSPGARIDVGPQS